MVRSRKNFLLAENPEKSMHSFVSKIVHKGVQKYYTKAHFSERTRRRKGMVGLHTKDAPLEETIPRKLSTSVFLFRQLGTGRKKELCSHILVGNLHGKFLFYSILSE